MADKHALISSKIGCEGGDWYIYEKSGFDPMILFHKEGHHGRDVRQCHLQRGWKITPLKVYDISDSDSID